MKSSKKNQDLIKKNAAFEGAFWSLEERLQNLEDLYQRFILLSPYRPEPLVKSFSSFEEYNDWKEKQTNPWYW